MRETTRLWQHASRFQSLLVLVLMIVAMSLLSDRFLTQANGLNIMRQISVNVCLSIGMTMVILSGGIDLSVGSVLAFAGAITAGLIKSAVPLTWLDVELQFTTWGAIVVGLIVGVFLGWFNGQMITRLKIPPFVATLGMLSVARGLTMLWTKGFPITGLIVAAIVLCLVAGFLNIQASAEEIVSIRSRHVSPVRLSEVKWTGGFWQQRFATCRDKTIPAMWKIMQGTKYKPYLEHFRIAAGLSEGKYRGAPFNDGDFYKWMEAACAVQATEGRISQT